MSVIWVVMVVLGAVVTGCEGARRYDSRLAAADSLMRVNPDSALAMVEAISRDSLSGEGDRAYRDLLLTQARYKAYVTATSDSDINRALAWFRTHPSDREKLTRAYIYKGAVMEELGHPDSAMLYYKTAEAIASPDDYFNLGYSNLRIAELYRDHYSQDSNAVICYKEAIRYFTLLSDTDYIVSTMGNLGTVYGKNAPDSAKRYLFKAIELAMEYNPSLQYEHKSTLAGVYFYQNDYATANRIAMDFIRNGRDFCEETQCYYYATLSYLKLGHVDSAKQVLSMIPKPVDAVDSMNYYDVLAELADADGDHYAYKTYKEISHDISDSILSESKDVDIAVAKIVFDNQQSEKDKEKESSNILLLTVIASILIISVVIGLALLHSFKLHRKFDAIKTELENTLAILHEQAYRNRSVSQLVAYRTAALDELYRDIRVRLIDDGTRSKKVIPLMSVFRGMHERNEFLKLDLKKTFWNNMILSVNGEFNGIYTFVENTYPNLTEKDLKIFCLLCANLSPQIIRMCMNLTSARTITNYRSTIIKKKMGLDMSLDTFIQKYLSGDFLGMNHP